MSLPLTDEQVAQLRVLIDAKNYPAAYGLLKDWTENVTDPDVQLFHIWLLGMLGVRVNLL